MTEATPLTKEDTVALWHAVDSYALQVAVMPSMTMPDGSTFTAEQIAAERLLLSQARRALRKANAIRKAQACRPTAELQADQKTAGGAGG